jgi:hypothetical protein
MFSFFFKVQDIICQLHRFITAMAKYHTDCHESMKTIVNIFPIEVDLPESMSNPNAYKNSLEAFEELSKSLEESDQEEDGENLIDISTNS